MNAVTLIIIALLVSIAFIILSTKSLKLHPFLSLFFASLLFGTIAGLSLVEVLKAIQVGFGTLVGQIGFIVAFGALLGTLLERSGAMEVISLTTLKMFGERHAVLAMSVVGAIVGIPVFCDSGFIVLSGLIPSIMAKTKIAGSSLALALASGLYISHTLVPPTPGPLAAASNLGLASALGSVIGFGILFTIPVVFVSYLFAKNYGHHTPSIKSEPASATFVTLPRPVAACTPLLLPLILIALGSFKQFLPESSFLKSILDVISTPVVALLLGVAACGFVLKNNFSNSVGWVAGAMKDAGVIILITGAGGSFGAVIKASGIESILQNINTGGFSGMTLLIIAWAIAATLKTAQGSTTSAMIITSSLMAPLMVTLHSDYAAPLLVCAIGGGAMAVSHANDSYFWVVSQFGGMTPQNMFRSFTLLTFVQGLTVLITVLIAALILGV
jgi:gluconate:H+ symporter, GntP family